jgi:hypothetical protein
MSPTAAMVTAPGFTAAARCATGGARREAVGGAGAFPGIPAGAG